MGGSWDVARTAAGNLSTTFVSGQTFVRRDECGSRFSFRNDSRAGTTFVPSVGSRQSPQAARRRDSPATLKGCATRRLVRIEGILVAVHSARDMVIALDLEGTLISNAVSQIPRPGLWQFLEGCRSLAVRVVIFTAVSEDRFRAIAERLVEDGLAPPWFSGIEYVRRMRRAMAPRSWWTTVATTARAPESPLLRAWSSPVRSASLSTGGSLRQATRR